MGKLPCSIAERRGRIRLDEAGFDTVRQCLTRDCRAFCLPTRLRRNQRFLVDLPFVIFRCARNLLLRRCSECTSFLATLKMTMGIFRSFFRRFSRRGTKCPLAVKTEGMPSSRHIGFEDQDRAGWTAHGQAMNSFRRDPWQRSLQSDETRSH
uniref:Uncharacterized protein n=1 Tax=Candidatus Kentrum sp. LFY TaxID=2126342 RepID=A0A450W6E4_9GAMM|nr:MAG: hypothetical protein BECKLFY1418C_GA0070996_100115 [Candidatus Kentron sp. LFY]